ESGARRRTSDDFLTAQVDAQFLPLAFQSAHVHLGKRASSSDRHRSLSSCGAPQFRRRSRDGGLAGSGGGGERPAVAPPQADWICGAVADEIRATGPVGPRNVTHSRGVQMHSSFHASATMFVFLKGHQLLEYYFSV